MSGITDGPLDFRPFGLVQALVKRRSERVFELTALRNSARRQSSGHFNDTSLGSEVFFVQLWEHSGGGGALSPVLKS